MKRFKFPCYFSILIFSLSISFNLLLAQNSWVRTYGESNEDAAMAISTIGKDRIAIAGWTKSFGTGYEDILCFVVDNDGKIIFEKSYGESQMDEAFALSSTFDGGIILGGTVQNLSFGSSDVALIRLDSLGNTLWQILIGNVDDDAVSSVISTDKDEFIGVGFSHPPTRSGFNITIFKVSSNGTLQWHKVLQTDSASYDFAREIIPLLGGGYVVLCSSSLNEQISGILLVEISENGDLIDKKFFSSDSVKLNPERIVELDDGFIIVGTALTNQKTQPSAFILKISKNFEPMWCKILSGIGYEILHSIVRSNDNTFFACGAVSALITISGFEYWLIKFDSDGLLRFSKTYGGLLDEHCHDLTITSDSCIALVGWTFSFGKGLSDIMVAKVDTSGSIVTGSIAVYEWSPNIDSLQVVAQTISMQEAEYSLFSQTAKINENHTNLVVQTAGYTSVQIKSPSEFRLSLISDYIERENLHLVINSIIEEEIELIIYDIFGRRIQKIPLFVKSGTQKVTINLEGLPNGLYFVRENQNKLSFKFLK